MLGNETILGDDDIDGEPVKEDSPLALMVKDQFVIMLFKIGGSI